MAPTTGHTITSNPTKRMLYLLGYSALYRLGGGWSHGSPRRPVIQSARSRYRVAGATTSKPSSPATTRITRDPAIWCPPNLKSDRPSRISSSSPTQRAPAQRPGVGPPLRVDQHHLPPALPRDRQGTRRNPAHTTHRAHRYARRDRARPNRCPQRQATPRQPPTSPTPRPGRREHRPTGHRQPPVTTTT
jgi:hypothetical protein